MNYRSETYMCESNQHPKGGCYECPYIKIIGTSHKLFVSRSI